MLLDPARRPQWAFLRAGLRVTTIVTDVFVVGLGPAGSRAAWAAARAGKRVLAVDRRQRIGEPVQCAELVPTLLHQEIADLAASTVQPIHQMHTYVQDDERDVLPNFPGAMISRSLFDSALAGLACEAGAECRTGVALVAVASNGVARLSDGTKVDAAVIIGADGPRSRVGRAVDCVNLDLTEAHQITVPLLARHFATDIFLDRDMPGGYGWLFPKGDVAHIGVGVAGEARAGLRALVEELHARLVRESRVGERVLCRTGGAIPAGGMVGPVASKDGVLVLLAGDAAGLANPITGAGISAAVQSGTLAGSAAAAWLHGDAGAAADYREEIQALFGAALARATQRRRALLNAERAGALSKAEQRRAWIAYPEYWTASYGIRRSLSVLPES